MRALIYMSCLHVPGDDNPDETRVESSFFDKARLAHGLPLLTPADWVGVGAAEKDPLPEV